MTSKKKHKRMPASVELLINKWNVERKKNIPVDWKSKVEIQLKELQHLILIEKNDNYDVSPDEVERFVSWKANLDEMMKKVEVFVQLKKTKDYDVENYRKDLNDLISSGYNIRKLIHRESWKRTTVLLYKFGEKLKNLIDTSKKEGPEFEKKKRVWCIAVARDHLIVKFEDVVIEFVKFLDYKIDID